VLTYKVAYLLEHGYAPWNILALTFTNKAAREMQERVGQLVGAQHAEKLWMGTFHSIFARILRIESQFLNFTSDFTIYDADDSKNLLKAIIREMQLDDKQYRLGTVVARISSAKNVLMLPEAYANDARARRDRESNMPLIPQIYAEYVRRCRVSNVMDFDDLLLNTWLLFQQHPEILEKYQERFQFVLVDEYQDTNYAQHRIVWELTKLHQRVCVVGDDAQSIYSFRGARIDNILGFDKVFGGTQIFRLERNYRSTQCIVNAANSLISKNKNQIPKKIFSENEEGSPLILNELTSDQEEGEMVSRRINTLRREGVKLSEIAILYRTNGQSRIMEECLRKHNIPYIVYGNHSFYEKKSVRDVMAYLRLVVNPSDEEALRRIINFPTRGIGSTTLDKIFACAQEGQTSAWNVVQQPDLYGLSVNNGTKARLQGFASMIKNFIVVNEAGADAYQLGQQVMKESGLIAQAQADITNEGREVMDDYSSLLSGMSQFVQNQREQGEELTVA
jgi:DNA helicase-2/ATP-dependent DNA helicase PcrA